MKRNGVLLTLLTVISLPLSLYQNLQANENVTVGCVERGETQQSNPKSETCGEQSRTIRNPQLDKTEFAQKTLKLQMPFIANKGQLDEQVIFYAKTFGGTVFVTKEGEIVYALPINSSDLKVQGSECRDELYLPNGISPLKRGTHPLIPSREGNGVCNKTPIPNDKNETPPLPLLIEGRTGVALREGFVGAKVKAIQGEQPSVTKVNYFKGNDPSKWKTNISTYDAVNLGEIYDGIELKLRAYGNNVEKLFCVKPGADPEKIKIGLNGTKSIKVNKEGQLETETELGPLNFTKPVAYQEIEGKRVEVECKYTIADCGMQNAEITPPLGPSREGINPKSETCGERSRTIRNPNYKIKNIQSENPKSTIRNPRFEYGFAVASYDRTKDLIIDPLLASTYLGGSDYDGGYAIVLDTSGNVYVTGYTESTDFPTTSGAYDTSFNDYSNDYSDVFVSKLDGGLTNLLASTYLGGSGDDKGQSLALDSNGNVYVNGHTYSTNFPTTRGAYDTSYNGGRDVFISKLNSGLTSLLASTCLGGPRNDYTASLALDTSGNVYVTGGTRSTDFPTTSGAYNTSYNGGDWDVFVSKLNSGLSSLLASTYLGGSDSEFGAFGTLLALDTSSGNVYVTGDTFSEDFPTTSGVYDNTFTARDAFISKFNSGLSSLLASTFLHGDISSLALDTSVNVYVTGYTFSVYFTPTSDAYDTSYNGSGDVFVSKLDGKLTRLKASTYLGGSGEEWGYSLALDTSGNVYVTGRTYSSDFPTTSGAYDTSQNGSYDVFVSKLDSDLSASTTCIGAIGGWVTDAKTGRPIVGASVAYGVGTSRQDFEIIDETETNDQGVYKFTPVECSDYVVIADANGYKRSRRTNVAQVSVGGGAQEQANFELQPRAAVQQ